MPHQVAITSLSALFSLTIFLGAGLLFLVEPMIAKMILPLLGGTPAVWNTCMMFFQAILLAGYGYAHIISRKSRINRQLLIHFAIFAVACLLLPIGLPKQWAPPSEGSPVGYIITLLALAVSVPFFILSSNSILLQRWFTNTGHPSAKDPYFLYSASNLGSMLALISYPLLIEPFLKLKAQSLAWSAGFIFLLLITACCAFMVKRRALSTKDGLSGGEGAGQEESVGADMASPGAGLRSRWIIFAFIPSSLMLGVTTFLSTDIAAIPLFWIVPLSIYLLSFIIVFARVPDLVHRAMVRLLPLSLLALLLTGFSEIDIPQWIIFAIHLANFFICSMAFHGEIARSRPAARHLTGFYLWISLGGALGGVFNTLIAPLVFNTVLEYPLVLILGALLLPVSNSAGFKDFFHWRLMLYIALPLVLTSIAYWAAKGFPVSDFNISWLLKIFHTNQKTGGRIIAFGLLFLLCYGASFLKRPLLFGIGIAAMSTTFIMAKDYTRDIVYRERSFFGVLTVKKESDETMMALYHGTTMHGKQWLDAEKRYEPLTYYHRNGPVGLVFSEFSGERKKSRIAVTGLGAGTIAAYAWKGQEMDFYEIDPVVKKIATNPRYFSYLSGSMGQWKIVLGDARLTMEDAPPGRYGMIILDAFSSDAIPVHLLTKEAMELYFSKMAADGVLLVHISNNYIDLAPVLANFAAAGNYAARICDDRKQTDEDKNSSLWVLMARKENDLGDIAVSSAWKKMEAERNGKVWTDDFSNILSHFKW